MKPLIAKRYSAQEDFNSLIPLKIGMCLTSRVNDDQEIIEPRTLPYPDFVYIVEKIKENTIILIDTAHNNTWDIPYSDLDGCELVQEFHKNVHDVDCEFINRVLSEN